MGKLTSTFIAAGALLAAAPALADSRQDDQRESARKACTDKERCREQRRLSPWYYFGPDEEAQSRRRPVRRLSTEF